VDLLIGLGIAWLLWRWYQGSAQVDQATSPDLAVDGGTQIQVEVSAAPNLTQPMPAGTIGNGLAQLDQIVANVIQAESGGRQTDANGNTLTSPKGALGLMQLMPATAAQLGVDPNDAQQNVAGGRKNLTQLYIRFGNWSDALAAYNWGPGNVSNALKTGASFPPQVVAYTDGILTNTSGGQDSTGE